MADSGIEGRVMIGPMCPVEREGQPCPDQPFAATLSIRRAGSEQELVVARSGEDGAFRVSLEPGSYVIVPASPNPGAPPYASPEEVRVEPGRYTRVTITYDSGIR